MSATVLVVDDSATVRAALKVELVAQGFEVVEASGARRALQLARLLRPAAALVDLQLGSDSGLDVLREVSGWSERPLLVAVSGDGSEAARTGARDAGAVAFLTKPLSSDDLRGVLAAVERT